MEKIFEKDEMTLVDVDPNWSKKQLLEVEGIFFLKDIVGILKLETSKVIKETHRLQSENKSPWLEMGLRKVWNHWTVRMTVFAPYYLKHLQPRYQSLDPSWDANTLLAQSGVYRLTDVCSLLPFSTYQLRYQALKNKNSKEEYGIWLDKSLKRWLVDMNIFSGWVINLWRQWNQHPETKEDKNSDASAAA